MIIDSVTWTWMNSAPERLKLIRGLRRVHVSHVYITTCYLTRRSAQRCRHIATALGNSCHGDPRSICNPEGRRAAAETETERLRSATQHQTSATDNAPPILQMLIPKNRSTKTAWGRINYRKWWNMRPDLLICIYSFCITEEMPCQHCALNADMLGQIDLAPSSD